MQTFVDTKRPMCGRDRVVAKLAGACPTIHVIARSGADLQSAPYGWEVLFTA